MTTVNALKMRKVLGRDEWSPPRPFGPDGWSILRNDRAAGVIVTAGPFDGDEWLHASFCRYDGVMPSYDDLKLLHEAVFGDGYAYQVFAPPSQHVNIHENALHLWGRTDGAALLPEFGAGGSI